MLQESGIGKANSVQSSMNGGLFTLARQALLIVGLLSATISPFLYGLLPMGAYFLLGKRKYKIIGYIIALVFIIVESIVLYQGYLHGNPIPFFGWDTHGGSAEGDRYARQTGIFHLSAVAWLGILVVVSLIFNFLRKESPSVPRFFRVMNLIGILALLLAGWWKYLGAAATGFT